MELIPVLILWLCMPLNARLPWPTVEDRGMFPSVEVISRERLLAIEAERRCWRAYSDTNDDGWKKKYHQASFAADAWNTLYYAHYWDNDIQNAGVLKLLRDQLGYQNYYAGQMPVPPVYISEQELPDDEKEGGE